MVVVVRGENFEEQPPVPLAELAATQEAPNAARFGDDGRGGGGGSGGGSCHGVVVVIPAAAFYRR